MSKATITFEDEGDGILVTTHFEGKFDPNSHAHQHVVLVMSCTEELLERNGTQIIEAAEH